MKARAFFVCFLLKKHQPKEINSDQVTSQGSCVAPTFSFEWNKQVLDKFISFDLEFVHAK